MMAGHFAADACKNGRLNAMAFNDAALLTAGRQRRGRSPSCLRSPSAASRAEGDLLIAISSSGNSPNILRALDVAQTKAMQIITVTGKNPDNRARARGELNFYVPADRYGWVECAIS